MNICVPAAEYMASPIASHSSTVRAVWSKAKYREGMSCAKKNNATRVK